MRHKTHPKPRAPVRCHHLGSLTASTSPSTITACVADAGLLPVTLAHRLGLGEPVDHHVDLGVAPGRANTGDKMLTLVASVLAGSDCIDDADALRAGGTARMLVCTVKSPSTYWTFLSSFRWGHVRQLDWLVWVRPLARDLRDPGENRLSVNVADGGAAPGLHPRDEVVLGGDVDFGVLGHGVSGVVHADGQELFVLERGGTDSIAVSERWERRGRKLLPPPGAKPEGGGRYRD